MKGHDTDGGAVILMKIRSNDLVAMGMMETNDIEGHVDQAPIKIMSSGGNSYHITIRVKKSGA
jgi:hypothetical protein